MKEIFKLAMRNLKEHKSKTIIISMFLIFGVAIVIMGNSFLESVNRGLEKDFRENYTGDIAIGIKAPKGMSIDIFGVDSSSLSTDIPQIPAIPDLDEVEDIVNSFDEVESQTKMISASVMVARGLEIDLNEIMDRDDLGFDDLPISMLFAGENGTYWNTFPKVNMVEGTYPAPGTNEIMIDTRVQKAFNSIYKEDLKIGETLLIMGANTKGIIREAKLVGIFNPPNENSAMFQIIYCDPSLARSFADLTYANGFSQDLPDSVDLSLSDMSEDDMFGSDEDMFEIDEGDAYLSSASTDFDDILGDTSLRDELNKTDDGAWHFILLNVKHPFMTDKIITQMNQKFDEADLDVYAMNWKAAANSYTQTVEGIGFIFNLLIIILAIVVFIIIMNTMTVSVIERTGEIGTMRAIGADKKFVKQLFYTEAVTLTFAASIIGVILAFVVMGIFNSFNITITNSIAKMILGGGLLHFSPTPKIIILTVVIALLGSIISNKYPVSSALKITPLKALSKGSD